jgi:UDP-N-acetyl-alpha-D-quinovosamine dehydrogenase
LYRLDRFYLDDSDSNSVKCLVSGATGFIGRRLCRQLLARGDQLVALSKSGSALADGTPTLALDLAVADPDSQTLQGVDVVFHLAGIAHQHAPAAAYHALNYQATLRLARLAAAAGVSRFVFLSSVKAMGPAVGPVVRSESDCTEPQDAYGMSKRRAEISLGEEFAEGRMSVVILRPALVYGGKAKGNLPLLARAVRMGLPRPPVGGGRSMVDLQDLVELLCLVSTLPIEGVHSWIVCDGQTYTTREICDELRRAGGKGVGLAWLPPWGWRLAAALLDTVSARSGEPTYSKLFACELYSNAAVLAATDWRPRRTLADGIAELAAAGGGV